MKKFLSIFLATSMVMSVCVATASVASAEVSSVELPTIYGQSYTWEAEAYADVINEQIYGTGSAKATICEQTYDNNSATAHETSKASGGKALMSGGVMPTTDAAPVKLTLPIYVPVETVYELEVVAGNESRVNANNYFALDGETIFTTTGGTSLTNNLGGTVTAEKLGWTAKKSDNGFYYQANKLTTRITIPAGNHTIEFAVPPRPSATYGGFMLDYIKLTSYGARGRVTLPTENSGYYTWEAEAYADVINEQIYGTGSAEATICEQTYDNNSATAHETSKASGGKALMSGGVMPTTDAAPVKLTLPIYVPVETVYELEVVAGNDSRVNVNNYLALDGETIFTTTGGTSLTNNLGGTVTAEKLGWTAKKSDNGFYYQANKLTTRITIPAGNHTIEFAVPPRPSATYGGFMLDYIKLTSCGVVKAYKTVEADNNFTRFEMSESFTNGETKTIKFTPSRTADYSLSVGTGAYRGTDITTDIASLSFTVTDSNGTKIMENLAVTPSPRNIQRVGANDFTADNLALEAGKEYTISVTATLNDGKTEGSISYIDLRCLTLDIGTQPALISAFDYYKIAHNGGGSTGGPNANTYWTAAKWNQMGSNLIGNYMDEDLAAKNECATSFHNAKATYKLNFTESGTYKVRLYGLNLAILNEGEASPKAAVSLDGDTLGTAVYDNDTDGLADATISTKRTLAPMDCPHTLYVTAGTYDMVVDTQSPDKLSIAGIVIEKVPEKTVQNLRIVTEDGARVPYVIKDGFKAFAEVNINKIDNNSDNYFLMLAQYASDSRFIDLSITPIDVSEMEIGERKTFSAPLTYKGNGGLVKAFLWDSETFAPLVNEVTYQDNVYFDEDMVKAVMNETVSYTDATNVLNGAGEKYADCSIHDENYDIDAIFYDSKVGEQSKVFAFIGVPKKDANGNEVSESNPVPAVVCVHGGGGVAYPQWIKEWNDKGYAAIAMSLTGDGPEASSPSGEIGESKQHIHPYAGLYCYGDSAFRANVEENSMYQNVLNIIRAHNVLRNYPGVDETKTGIMGVSWGGVTTTMTIGVDNRFKFAIPVYGCGYLDESETYFSNYFKDEKNSVMWDPANFAARSTVPTLYVNSDSDEHFSINSTTKSSVVTSGSRMVIRNSFGHSHSHAWNFEQIYAFADGMVNGYDPFITITSQKAENGTFTATYTAPEGITAQSADLYYITTSKLPYGGKDNITWTKISGGTIANNTVSFTLPDGATFCYATVKDNNGNLISSKFIEVK